MKRLAVAVIFLIGVMVGSVSTKFAQASSLPRASADRGFELRTYAVADGQLPALNSRSRYLTPTDYSPLR